MSSPKEFKHHGRRSRGLEEDDIGRNVRFSGPPGYVRRLRRGAGVLVGALPGGRGALVQFAGESQPRRINPLLLEFTEKEK